MARSWMVTIGGLLIVLALGAAVSVAGARWLGAPTQDAVPAAPGVRHAALHINCPPGSHGVPRYAKFGQSLGYGRDGTRTPPMRDRGLTAANPARAPSNP